MCVRRKWLFMKYFILQSMIYVNFLESYILKCFIVFEHLNFSHPKMLKGLPTDHFQIK